MLLRVLYGLSLGPLWKILWQWVLQAWQDLTAPTGYRVVVPVTMTIVGAYFGLYAVMEARHERRLNRAVFKQSTFINLVTSSNRGAFIMAMKDFGLIQTMEVPPEPHPWPPWHFLDWWDEPTLPNKQQLSAWAATFLPLCTPQTCGRPKSQVSNKPSQDVRIDLEGANLQNADLFGVELEGADLSGANLKEASLRGAHLREANRAPYRRHVKASL